MTATMACRGPGRRGRLDSTRTPALGHRRLVGHRPGGRPPADVGRGAGTGARVPSVDSPTAARSTTTASCASELAAAGHRFRTRSDTEVVLHAYLEWGEERRRAPQRHVRVRALGRRARGTAAGPRPDGHQAALLLPDAATACCSAPSPRRSSPTRSRAAGRGRRRPARAARRSSRRPSHAVYTGHARGAPGPRGPGRPRPACASAATGARGPRAHRRPGHHVAHRPGAARRHRRPPADRRRAAVHPAVRRPGLLGDHRAGGRRAWRTGAPGRSAPSPSTSSARPRTSRPTIMRDTPDAPFVHELAEHVAADHSDIVLDTADLMDAGVRSRRPAARTTCPRHRRHVTPRSTCCSRRSASTRRSRCPASRPTRCSAATCGSTTRRRSMPTRSPGWRCSGARVGGSGWAILDPGLARALDLRAYRADRYREALAEVPAAARRGAGWNAGCGRSATST